MFGLTIFLWTIVFHSARSSEIVTFRIRHCEYEFFLRNAINRSAIRIPISFFQKEINLKRNKLSFCKLIAGKQKKVNLKALNIGGQTSFLCQYEGTLTFKEENIVENVLSLFSINFKEIESEGIIYKIVEKIRPFHKNLDFNLMTFDLIMEVYNYLKVRVLITKQLLFKWSIEITYSLLKDVNYFSTMYLADPKNIKLGSWSSPRTSITFEVVKGRVFLNLFENKPNNEYSYTYYNMSASHQYIALISSISMTINNYIVLVWKPSRDVTIKCTVWFKSDQPTRNCEMSGILPDWEVCNCDVLGVIVIETIKNPTRLKNIIYRLGGLTPSFIDIMNVKNLENKYRYGRMGDYFIIAAIIITLVDIIVLAVLIMYYEKRWRCHSPTRRQILCLFALLWLNILLLQPMLITFFFRNRARKRSTEYIAWGLLALYSISAYTLMIGGTQIVLFVSTVNSKLWSCRFCDLILGFIVLVCCATPFLIFYQSYYSVVVSINRLMLLPEDSAATNFVLIPLVCIGVLCFILSGIGCYLPKRGGGISMMIVIYPLLFLHGLSYYMVLLMKESKESYNYLQYMVYTSGIFLQAIYLIIWLAFIILLPLKNLTIFGKRDCNFRLEYIYLIDLHCPKTEDNCAIAENPC